MPRSFRSYTTLRSAPRRQFRGRRLLRPHRDGRGCGHRIRYRLCLLLDDRSFFDVFDLFTGVAAEDRAATAHAAALGIRFARVGRSAIVVRRAAHAATRRGQSRSQHDTRPKSLRHRTSLSGITKLTRSPDANALVSSGAIGLYFGGKVGIIRIFFHACVRNHLWKPRPEPPRFPSVRRRRAMRLIRAVAMVGSLASSRQRSGCGSSASRSRSSARLPPSIASTR